MKKRILAILLVLGLVAAIAIPMAAPVVAAPTSYVTPPSYAQQYTLFGGKTINVGSVWVWNDATTLYVEYQTTGKWLMSETHLQIATALSDIPQTKTGNPIPGHFAMGDTLNPAANWDYFTYPLPPSGTTLYIAAQAEVSKPGDSETAWGALPCGSYGFPGKNWATYFTYTVPTLAFNTGITSDGVSLPGTLVAGFTIATGGAAGMHVLGLAGTVSTPNLIIGSYAFYLTPSVPQTASLEAYFGAKSGWSSGWESQINSEITGSAPFFFLKYDGTNYSLVDNFKLTENLMSPYPLTIDDDYPVGTYVYTGILTGTNGGFLPVTVTLTVTRMPVRAGVTPFNTPPAGPTIGYAAISANGAINVTLTGGTPSTGYGVYVEEYTGTTGGVGNWVSFTPAGSLTTDGTGAGSSSASISLTSGTHYLQVVLGSSWILGTDIYTIFIP